MASHVQLGCAKGTSYAVRKLSLSQGGDAAIFATIRLMNALVRGPEGVQSPQIRIAAIEAVRGVARGRDEIDSVFRWVKQNIEFRGERSEWLQSPLVTLQLHAGDCDDHSTLLAALLASLGFRVRFNTVAAIASDPDQFSHVFTEVYDRRRGEWVPVDTTVPQSYPGWRPERIFRMRTYRALGGPPRRGLGDDMPVSGFAQVVQSSLQPIINAEASQIAHGTVPQAQLGLSLDSNTGGIPSLWLVLFGLFLAYAALKR